MKGIFIGAGIGLTIGSVTTAIFFKKAKEENNREIEFLKEENLRILEALKKTENDLDETTKNYNKSIDDLSDSDRKIEPILECLSTHEYLRKNLTIAINAINNGYSSSILDIIKNLEEKILDENNNSIDIYTKEYEMIIDDLENYLKNRV